MSSAAVPVEIIPGIAKAIPGSGENRSPSRRNPCSRSARNPVRLHPGTLFAFTPESRSPCPGIRTLLIAERDKLNRAIEALQGRPLLVPAAAPKKKRKRQSAVLRKAKSDRMKAYWAARRKKAK